MMQLVSAEPATALPHKRSNLAKTFDRVQVRRVNGRRGRGSRCLALNRRQPLGQCPLCAPKADVREASAFDPGGLRPDQPHLACFDLNGLV